MIDAKSIEKFATCIGFKFNQEGSQPSMVIVGERHETIERCCQELLIKKLRPEYVLIETLHALSSDPESDCIKFREGAITDENDLEELRYFEKNADNYYRQMSKKYNIKLIGCDLSLGERNRFIEDLGINTWGMNPLTIDDLRIDDARENKMGNIVFNYSGSSSKPVIAIIGNWHARKDSKIHEKLKENIEYICIWSEKAVDEVKERKKRNRRSKVN